MHKGKTLRTEKTLTTHVMRKKHSFMGNYFYIHKSDHILVTKTHRVKVVRQILSKNLHLVTATLENHAKFSVRNA